MKPENQIEIDKFYAENGGAVKEDPENYCYIGKINDCPFWKLNDKGVKYCSRGWCQVG